MKNKNEYLYVTIMIIAVFFISPMLGYEDLSANGRTHDAAVSDEDYGEHLGTVNFPVSCNEAARGHAERGLALLHNMTYEGARAEFAEATVDDSDCAMGFWGQAMSFIHPLWSDPPDEAEFKSGQDLLKKARTRGKKTEWERAYIAAAESYYAAGRDGSEKVNLASYEKAWEKVYRQFPEDLEAACLYALAHMATADPSDKTYTKQKRAGTIAEKVLYQAPDHPGAHHYIIHAYDYPELAEQALSVARNYGKIAPSVPHALHMPTHIFTRYGIWEESVTMNRRSADAALKHPVGGAISLHYTHALDYLAYAYLQRGEDEKAKQVMDTVSEIKGPVQVHVASAYTFAAVPARLALERQDWADAASLKPRLPANYPWDRFPAMEAITYFARALGAARSGNVQAAGKAIDNLTAMRDLSSKTSAYWTKQIEIMRLSAMAWLKYDEGAGEKALHIMQRAAGLETSTEKHPVTPGEVLPARELLGDMLLEMGHHREARAAYETALKRSPNRLNSIYGAGRAAELSGNKKDALSFYRKLVEITAKDSKRERLQQARAFLSKN
ncbi:MAG: tetratricopeptide repeat protein [Nitrospirota bacterium]